MDTFALREIEAAAHDVIKRHPFLTLPICPFAIAKKADILVAAKDSKEPGVSGFLMRVGDVFGIQYASHIDNEGFIRFTISHELGHYYLPGHADHLFANGNMVHSSRSGYVSHDKYEREADCFASALLMPETMFVKAIEDAGAGFPAVESLAKTCKTSITATAIRYAKFTDDVVAVIVSAGQSVEYCFLSERLRDVKGMEWLKKGDLLPPRSATAEFNRDADNVADGRREEGASDLDDWFDGAPGVEMNEDVVGLGSYGKTLTVLFTDNGLDDDEDDEDCEDDD